MAEIEWKSHLSVLYVYRDLRYILRILILKSLDFVRADFHRHAEKMSILLRRPVYLSCLCGEDLPFADNSFVIV